MWNNHCSVPSVSKNVFFKKKTAHFRVALYCDQPSAHLLGGWILFGEVLIDTDFVCTEVLHKYHIFYFNLWEIWAKSKALHLSFCWVTKTFPHKHHTDSRKQQCSINHCSITDTSESLGGGFIADTLFFYSLIQHQSTIYSKPFMPGKQYEDHMLVDSSANSLCTDIRSAEMRWIRQKHSFVEKLHWLKSSFRPSEETGQKQRAICGYL